jgi:hypothetical protein
MRDFTIHTYKKLLIVLQQQGYLFIHFNRFQSIIKNSKRIVLRNDVDTHNKNSLQFAILQHNLGIVGTYYFRIVPQSFDEKIIKEIAGLGHEIGYHYETMETCLGNLDKAYDEFCRNLELFRKLVPVVTVCMHGSPVSKFDNREIWRRYDYRKLNIIAEPYFDVDFSETLYLTDTGRRWNGSNVSIRDKGLGISNKELSDEDFKEWMIKPISGSLINMSHKSIDFQNKYRFNSTAEIIRAAERGDLPDRIMMTIHPQRWTDKPLSWARELVWQNVKNVGKYFLVKLR